MLVGSFAPGALELSYEAAFRDLGCDVRRFDIREEVQRYCRLGGAGWFFNMFVPVEPWILKANRNMVLDAYQFRPDILAVFGQNPVRVGPLAQLRAMGKVSTVLVWPDTLVNLSPALVAALTLYDMVATYSSSTTRQFEMLGTPRAEWVPLAADPHMYSSGSQPESSAGEVTADVSFIGQWRPEREQALNVLLSGSQGLRVKIWGPDWGRRCRGNPAILRAWQGRSLYGQAFAEAISRSRVSLNVIDPTNYPAANMRFFEIPCAGGLQVCSACPEMEAEFKHGETVFYYRGVDELPGLIRSLLDDEALRGRVALAAREKVLKEHTYTHRAGQILERLGLR